MPASNVIAKKTTQNSTAASTDNEQSNINHKNIWAFPGVANVRSYALSGNKKKKINVF